jgi:plasmid stabilization system protein ParE
MQAGRVRPNLGPGARIPVEDRHVIIYERADYGFFTIPSLTTEKAGRIG